MVALWAGHSVSASASYTDSAGANKSLSYDARGNVTALGALNFTYDMADQPRAISESSTFNRYAYTFNDPVNLTDPTGECPMCLGALISAGLEAAIIGVEVAAGKEVSAKEIAVRLGSSAVAGAAGVGILTKVKSVGKIAGSLQKVTAPAGNGNSIKVGNVLAGGFEGAVSGATSEVVGAEIHQAFGVGDGASLQGTAVAAVTGGVFGAASGGFTGDSIGEAVNSGVTPTVGNSVNAQAGIVESAVGLFGAAAEGARREDE